LAHEANDLTRLVAHFRFDGFERVATRADAALPPLRSAVPSRHRRGPVVLDVQEIGQGAQPRARRA
jgi:hypothetical protein